MSSLYQRTSRAALLLFLIGIFAGPFVSMAYSDTEPTQQGPAASGRISVGGPQTGARSGVLLSLGSTIRSYMLPERGLGGLALVSIAALVYGVLHALGPGHQKGLVSSFVLAEGGGLRRVAACAMASATGHALSVFGLFAILLALEGTLNATGFAKASEVSRIVSGFGMISISSWLLIQRIKSAYHRHARRPVFQVLSATKASLAPLHTNECGCASCRSFKPGETKSSNPALLIVGSLIPCPGAALFLLAGRAVGNALAGIIAVIALSGGMWITLMVVGSFALSVRVAGERLPTNAKTTATARSIYEIAGSMALVGFSLALLVWQ